MIKKVIGWLLFSGGAFYFIVGGLLGLAALIGPLTGRGPFIEGVSGYSYVILPLLMIPVCWFGWKLAHPKSKKEIAKK